MQENEQIIAYFHEKQQRTELLDGYYFKEALQQYRPLLNKLVAQYIAANRRHEFFVYAELALYQALEDFDAQKGRLLSCIYQYVKTALVTELRRDAKFHQQHLICEDYTLHTLCEARESKPQDVSEYFEQHVLQHITTQEYAFLYAYYVENYSYEELSERLGVSVAALKKRRLRIVTRLRQRAHV